MPTDMQTVNMTADYQVAASDQLVFTNQGAFVLSQAIHSDSSVGPPPHLTISGEVDVVMTSASAAGASGLDAIQVNNTFNSNTAVTIDPGGLLKLTVTGGSAIGYFGGGNNGPTFDNHGAVIVSADGSAIGVETYTNEAVLTNSGQITVTSTTSDATGLKTFGYLPNVVNTGTITVTGHGQVTGVDLGAGSTGEVFHNWGTITAHDDTATKTSVGVFWGSGAQPGQPTDFVNYGTIEGDTALSVNIGYGTAADNLITNNGHLIGNVLVVGGAQTITNNGDITGAVDFWGNGNVYDGRLGTVEGVITEHQPGGDTLMGGAGAETITGGQSADSISGGGGDDVIDGGGGADHVDGGAGINTLSFATNNGGAQVDLASGTAHQTYWVTETFTNFTNLTGGGWSDTLVGDAGANQLDGGGGNDSLDGGAGDDVLIGGAGSNVLYAGDGNDSIQGGSGFDITNGNKGDDTIDGGSGGNDWLVGGQGNDLISAHTSNNILYGNIGADTLHGGSGADLIRGGQGDDVIVAGAGDDWISGDRGSDTLTGGTGADTFHAFSGSGLDIVTDFNFAQGDHVQIDAGTSYTLNQVGTDVVVDMGNGDEPIVKNMTLTALPQGWIFSL